MKRAPVLALALCFGWQVALLFSVIGYRQSLLASPTVIRLKTEPVDPWDVFRGEYVWLGYDISSVDTALLDPAVSEVRAGQLLFVTVKQGEDGFWHATRVVPQRPAPASGEVVLQGHSTFWWTRERETPGIVPRPVAGSRAIGVAYGLEAFYVPQGESERLQPRSAQRESLVVEAAVSRSGRAAIKRVLLDGKEVKFR